MTNTYKSTATATDIDGTHGKTFAEYLKTNPVEPSAPAPVVTKAPGPGPVTDIDGTHGMTFAAFCLANPVPVEASHVATKAPVPPMNEPGPIKKQRNPNMYGSYLMHDDDC